MKVEILNSVKSTQNYVIVFIVLQFFITTFLMAQPNYPYCVQANSTTEGDQDSPEIAVNSKGTILAMYESTLSGSTDENILAVSYDRKTFKEFYHSEKESDTATLEAFPNSDKFLVSWEHSKEIYFAIVSCNDNNEEFIVGPKPIRDDQKIIGKRPDVAISRDGSLFVIGWERYDGVLMQFFDSTGAALGEVTGVSDTIKRRAQIGFKFWPDSTLAACWQTTKWTGVKDDIDIWYQIFDCRPVWAGNKAIPSFPSERRANGPDTSSYVEFVQEYPEVDVFDDGRLAIMWQDFPYSGGVDGTDGSGKGAYFRIINRDGTFQTDDIQLSEHTLSFQKDADIRIRQSDATIHFIYEDAYESTVEQSWLAYPSYRVFDDQGEASGPSVELSDKSYGTDCRIAITEGDAAFPNSVLWVWETKDIQNYDGSGRAVIFRDSSNTVSSLENLLVSDPLLPEQMKLFQNYPNPFNPSTMINYQLPITGYVELSIYTIIGQKVATLVSENQQAGAYQVEWNASGMGTGVYFYQLKTETHIVTKKMMFLQ